MIAETMTPVIPRWRGLNRRGEGRTGAMPPGTDVAAFVEDKFDAGWRMLSVTRGTVEVGGITDYPGPLPSGGQGRRVWWAEA